MRTVYVQSHWDPSARAGWAWRARAPRSPGHARCGRPIATAVSPRGCRRAESVTVAAAAAAVVVVSRSHDRSAAAIHSSHHTGVAAAACGFCVHTSTRIRSANVKHNHRFCIPPVPFFFQRGFFLYTHRSVCRCRPGRVKSPFAAVSHRCASSAHTRTHSVLHVYYAPGNVPRTLLNRARSTPNVAHALRPHAARRTPVAGVCTRLFNWSPPLPRDPRR